MYLLVMLIQVLFARHCEARVLTEIRPFDLVFRRTAANPLWSLFGDLNETGTQIKLE